MNCIGSQVRYQICAGATLARGQNKQIKLLGKTGDGFGGDSQLM
jgi:hypothetical protein